MFKCSEAAVCGRAATQRVGSIRQCDEPIHRVVATGGLEPPTPGL
jgi:hypothetical protein